MGVGSSAAAAPAVELEGLVKNSPFGQAAERTVIGEAKPGTLEFRGLYVDKGVTYFSVYNSITKQSAWIAEGEVPANLPVTIVGFDAAAVVGVYATSIENRLLQAQLQRVEEGKQQRTQQRLARPPRGKHHQGHANPAPAIDHVEKESVKRSECEEAARNAHQR